MCWKCTFLLVETPLEGNGGVDELAELAAFTETVPMRRSPSVFFATLILLTTISSPLEAEDTRPNILFILSDDHRADFLGCAGHPILKTPHLDKLAAKGTRFTNASVTTSICAASRASILTGLHERTHKFTFGTPPIAARHTEDSYPAVLRRAGYRTGFVGKFGVNVMQGAQAEMFDSFVPLNRNPYFKKQADGTKRHLTEITGDRAITFLEETDKTQPFCLSISFNAAHAEDSDKNDHFPWPKAMDGLYDDVTIPEPRHADPEAFTSQPRFLRESMNRDRWFWRWDTPEKYQRNVKAYYRMISGLDHVVGRVLEKLDQLGMAKNTVVIFTGDNGYYKGSRGFAGKWSHYEESLLVPLIIHDPRHPQEEATVDLPVLNIDLPATMLEYAGIPTPIHYAGARLNGLAEGKTPDHWRRDTFHEHLMDNASIPKWEGIRGRRYIYARYFQQSPVYEFLHDLDADPGQRANFAHDPACANMLTSMRARCDQRIHELGKPYRLEDYPTLRWLRAQPPSN